MAVNLKEGASHKASFEVFTKGLEEYRPTKVKEWREWVERWESKQHTDASESPFELKEEGASGWFASSWRETETMPVKTLRDVQLEIAAQEFICTDDGVEVEQEHTPGTFVSMGLELEDVQ